MNYFDLALLVFIIFFIVRGYMQGLVKAVFHFFGYIFAAVITYFYYPNVKGTLMALTKVDETVKDFVIKRLQDLGANATATLISPQETQALEKMALPQRFIDKMTASMQASANEAMMTLADSVTDVVLNMLSFAALFVLIVILVKLLASTLNLIAKLPVLKSINAMGGALVGALKGYVIVCILFVISMTVLSMKTLPIVDTYIETSVLAPYFIDYNLLLMWFSHFA